MLREFNDVWELRDGHMRAVGDALLIDDLLKNKLVEVQKKNWAILYRHKETGEFWDLTYPQSEMHGGGPRRLRMVIDPNDWTPYPQRPGERR
jgi:immunity protein 27 of polymorphic toxin system